MTVVRPGVHRSHCCRYHGCKYGNPACPVESGDLVQDRPCEVCETSRGIARAALDYRWFISGKVQPGTVRDLLAEKS